MIALDIGGTKTSIFFSEKKNLKKFKKEYSSIIKEIDEKQKFCVIPTFLKIVKMILLNFSQC